MDYVNITECSNIHTGSTNVGRHSIMKVGQCVYREQFAAKIKERGFLFRFILQWLSYVILFTESGAQDNPLESNAFSIWENDGKMIFQRLSLVNEEQTDIACKV